MGHKSPYNIRGNNKIIPSLISKPEQGSKSREFSELIHRDLTEDINTLSFYICPCRRNQADQAENNFIQYNEYYQEDKKKIDVLHGEKQSSKDQDGYMWRAENEGQRLIISIVHKVRLEVVYKIIVKWINKNPNHKVKIYLDEAGESKTFNAFIKHIWSKLETDINRRLINVFPIFIDAHSKALLNNKSFVKYFPMKTVHKLKNKYDLDNYMFMSSMTYISYEWKDTNDILESIGEGNIKIDHNDYILWPFPKVKDQQYSDAEEISSSINNICVLDINGEGYHVYININGKSKPKLTLPKRKCGKRKCGHKTCPKCNLECTDEMSAIKLIKKEYAFNIPLILCGHDCIDRAMTYHEPGFSFTKAFIARNNLLNDPFSNCSDKKFNELSDVKQEKVSQMVKRISSSWKDKLIEDKVPLPIIYGPQDIYDGICDLENKSTYIANQNGYITTELRNEMDSGRKMLCEYPLFNTDDIKKLEIKKEPYEFYMIKFNHNLNKEKIKEILSEFRNNIGDSYVQLRTIKKRWDGVEPDNNLGELKLEMFYKDYQLLKTALDENTTSRIRVCKDENGDIKWIITFQMKRDEFIWDGKKYKIIKIIPDGNCLFNCFIKSDTVSELLDDFRYSIKEYIKKYQKFYDKQNMSKREWDLYTDPIKNNGEWDKDIFDIVPDVISEMLKLNIYIFHFKSMNNDGLNMIMNKPTIIDGGYAKNIYLRKLDNHYDLMIPL